MIVVTDHAGVCAGGGHERGPQALQQERAVSSGAAVEDRTAGASSAFESLRSERRRLRAAISAIIRRLEQVV